MQDDDIDLFRQSISGATKIKQDTVQFKRDNTPFKGKIVAEQTKQHKAEFYFSEKFVSTIF